METPYGDVNLGDIFEPADGTDAPVKVIDLEEYVRKGDVLIQYRDGTTRAIDIFKLMMVRYRKKST
jgi:hypothetical protein